MLWWNPILFIWHEMTHVLLNCEYIPPPLRLVPKFLNGGGWDWTTSIDSPVLYRTTTAPLCIRSKLWKRGRNTNKHSHFNAVTKYSHSNVIREIGIRIRLKFPFKRCKGKLFSSTDTVLKSKHCTKCYSYCYSNCEYFPQDQPNPCVCGFLWLWSGRDWKRDSCENCTCRANHSL